MDFVTSFYNPTSAATLAPPAVSTFTLVLMALFIAAGLLLFKQQHSSLGTTKPIPSAWLLDPALYALFTGQMQDLPAVHRRYGPIVRARFLGQPVLLVGGLANVRALLNADHTVIRTNLPRAVVNIFGPDNLQQLRGHEHTQKRRLLNPIFSPRNLGAQIPRIVDVASELVEEWISQSGRGAPIYGYSAVREYVITISAGLLMGIYSIGDSKRQIDRLSKLYADVWAGLFTFPVNLPGTSYRRALQAKAALCQMIAETLDASSASFATKPDTTNSESTSVPAPSALQMLMETADENGNPVPAEEVQSLLTALLLGAVDTTATALLATLRRLAQNPDLMEALEAEQAAVVAEHGSEWSENAVRSMRLAEAVVKETIRLESPSRLLFRKAMKDTEVDGYRIRKGEILLLHIGETIAHDERWSSDEPEVFKPQRWLCEAGNRVGGWIPFGGGAHLCVGMQLALLEVRLMVAMLARQSCRLKLMEPDEKWKTFPLMKPEHGMPLKITRKSTAVSS